MKGKIPLAEAQRIAWDWTRRFTLDCKRIEVAGSVRRKCEIVGDIEIVAIPKPSFFGRILDLEQPGNGHKPLLVTKGAPGLRNGKARYVQIYDKYEDVFIDLFLTTPETWSVIFAIRTGSAEFSHGLMGRANRIGLTSYQGRLVPNSELIRGGNDKVKSMGLAAPLDTPEERDVFEALQIEWVEPPMRRGFSDIKPLSRRRPQGEDGPS